MTLIEKQLLFPRLLAKLLTYADDSGTRVTVGECYRTKEQAAWNAAHGTGIAKSLHCDRLAIDLQCFRMHNGVWTYLARGDEPEYALLGQYWERLHELCSWGGDFGDPGHFSIRHDGRR